MSRANPLMILTDENASTIKGIGGIVMKVYGSEEIRNVVLLGHGGVGKTTVAEAMAYASGAIKRRGKVQEGNTVSDYDPEEVKRGFSINASVIPIEWDGFKYNILDTPGYFDFVGEAREAAHIAEAGIIVVSAKSGVQVGTELAWEMLEERKTPRFIFVNGMDEEGADLVRVLQQLQDTFGKRIAPFQVPFKENGKFSGFVNVVKMEGRKYVNDRVESCPVPDSITEEIKPVRQMILETVAESSESLMERYFETEGEDFTLKEIQDALQAGIVSGDIVPVLCGVAANGTGIGVLMTSIGRYLPSPNTVHPTLEAENEKGEEIEVPCTQEGPMSAFVFKTVVDPFFGKITYFKVVSGILRAGDTVTNVNKGVQERLNHIYIPRGKEQIEVTELHAGDIGIVTKLAVTGTCDTLCGKGISIEFPPIAFPESLLCMAVMPKSKGDEEKISSGLSKLMEEDPTLKAKMDKETKQQQIFGIGDQHLDVTVNKLKNKFKLDVDLKAPKVAYRETIKGTARVQGKHKKQSGGHGQYGDVHIIFEPSGDMETPCVFEEKIFGGSVPKNYFPAVEKGLQECVQEGVLAGYPMVGVKATLVDGSYHPVDSSEMAFKMATSIAFKNGIPQAKPVILEPVSSVKITVDEAYMGDVIGDMNKRRGRVLGMTHQGKKQIIEAEVPTAEMFTYATDLRSMTQARGSFTMSFLRYEEVPRDVQEKIIAASKKE